MRRPDDYFFRKIIVPRCTMMLRYHVFLFSQHDTTYLDVHRASSFCLRFRSVQTPRRATSKDNFDPQDGCSSGKKHG